MKNSLITLLFLLLALSVFSQDIRYEVRGTNARPIVKENLSEAKTVSDINPGYPSSWVSGYISVELFATCNSIVWRAVSANDTLSNEQISILKMADMGTDIVVDVKYNPKKSSKQDIDAKEINFSMTLVPYSEAIFPGGYQLLKQYLKENAIDKIPEATAGQLQQAIVRFTINEEGQATNAQISMTSEDKEIDKLLLETITNMPKWKPAENSDGTKVEQEFEFSVGNVDGC